MDPSFAERDANVGFSGGRRSVSRLQMNRAQAFFAILDETDSGLIMMLRTFLKVLIASMAIRCELCLLRTLAFCVTSFSHVHVS